MADYLLTYPSQRETADQVLDEVLSILADFDVDEAVIMALSVAVSEAFTNAVIHGNRENPAKTVEIRLLVNDTQIVADISDQGKGGIERIESRKPSTALDEGGRGVDLIRHYADSCSFSETEGGGLVVSMAFCRTGKTMMRNSS